MEQEQQTTSAYMSPMYNYGSSIIQLTNPEDLVIRMELTLRNQVIDKDGKTISKGEPLLNDEGIISMLGAVQSTMNQVTIMSNLDSMEISQLMLFLNDALCKDLMLNRIRYDIKSKSTRDKIFHNIMTSCFITMKRAFKEGDRRFWKGSQQDIRTEIVNGGGQNKNLFSKILGWNK